MIVYANMNVPFREMSNQDLLDTLVYVSVRRTYNPAAATERWFRGLYSEAQRRLRGCETDARKD